MSIQIRALVAELLLEYQDTKRKLYLEAAEEICRLQSMVDLSRIDDAIPLIVSINTIMRVTAENYRMGVNTIKSYNRKPKYVEARMTAVVVCRRMTRATYFTLGQQFKRTHAAIIYLEKRGLEREKRDPHYADVIYNICGKCAQETKENPMETTYG